MDEIISRLYKDNCIFPIIYDIKDVDHIIKCKTKVVLMGRILNVLNIKRLVSHLKNNGKIVIVDIDLIGGLNNDEYAVDYIAKEAGADGIISTHGDAIFKAKREGMITILKVFAYDDYSVNSAIKVMNFCKPQIVEVLPGIAVPFFIKNIRQNTNVPINASGFTGNRIPEIVKLLKTGVSAIHTGNQKLWDIDLLKYLSEENGV